MFQKLLKVLLYVVIVSVISGAIIAGFLFMGRPIAEPLIVIGVLATLWILFIVIRTLIIRARAKKQVQRVLQEEAPDVTAQAKDQEKKLLKDLRDNWRNATKALRNSQLKLHGNPLYVLPWFMVFGKPASGKSTSLKSAKLLAPKIDFPDHAEGSTVNLDWWLYEEAIVIDTAGRYAVPEEEKRDRKEWRSFLRMLATHKQKEPLSGLVVVVAADRLLNDSEEMLREEGRQLRASLSDLMGNLEAKPPIYLMVTKCDLVPGFSEWCDYLPAEAMLQPMGYLNEQEGGTLDDTIDRALDAVLDRMKELRLLMLERSHNSGDSLLTLPVEMEKLRSGLHLFANTALRENVYQETPRFRGLYFTSSLQKSSDAKAAGRSSMGAFLHHFYTRVLPSDRGMTDNLAAALRIRNAVRNFSIGIGGVVTVVALFVLSSFYSRDLTQLERIQASYGAIKLNHDMVNAELASLNRLRELIIALDSANENWVIPWTGSFERPAPVQELVNLYNAQFRSRILQRIDEPLKKRIATLTPAETSVVAGGIVRRVNIIKRRLAANPEEQAVEMPEVDGQYVMLVEHAISEEAAANFNDLYTSYVAWNNSPVALAEERVALQSALVELLDRNQGDYNWVIDWANNLGGEPVRLTDFWGGSRTLAEDAPIVPVAYTLAGREVIHDFMSELGQANDDGGKLAKIMEDFDEFYERKYVKQWVEFAKRFDEGQTGLQGRKEWLNAVERMATDGNPYFALMERLRQEMEPITYDDDFLSRDLVDYFSDMKSFVGADSAEGGKGNSKMALKLLSKAGKVGKMAAKVGKKAIKAKKKMGGGKSPEQLEDLLEQAAKTLEEYQTALSSVAFNAESRPQSASAMATAFTNPDTPGSGEGHMAEAEKAVIKLQMLLGKPNVESGLFWQLYTGPIRVSHEFMREETACHLQDQWDKTVLAELEGVARNKIGNALIGEGGLLWKYIEGNAVAFLQKRQLRGYQPAQVNGKSIPWTQEFLEFANNGSVGKNVVNGEFVVRMSALPTGVNHSAALSPYSAILNLRCADGVQTLANYNYNSTQDFKWSLEKCGDVSLSVAIGQMTLRKEYLGEKGFPEFLADFRDGHRVFVAEEFPDVASQLRNIGVQAIDVNYQITGQEPVIQVLRSVPLAAPAQVAACWQ